MWITPHRLRKRSSAAPLLFQNVSPSHGTEKRTIHVLQNRTILFALDREFCHNIWCVTGRRFWRFKAGGVNTVLFCERFVDFIDREGPAAVSCSLAAALACLSRYWLYLVSMLRDARGLSVSRIETAQPSRGLLRKRGSMTGEFYHQKGSSYPIYIL